MLRGQVACKLKGGHEHWSWVIGFGSEDSTGDLCRVHFWGHVFPGGHYGTDSQAKLQGEAALQSVPCRVWAEYPEPISPRTLIHPDPCFPKCLSPS